MLVVHDNRAHVVDAIELYVRQQLPTSDPSVVAAQWTTSGSICVVLFIALAPSGRVCLSVCPFLLTVYMSQCVHSSA